MSLLRKSVQAQHTIVAWEVNKIKVGGLNLFNWPRCCITELTKQQNVLYLLNAVMAAPWWSSTVMVTVTR